MTVHYAHSHVCPHRGNALCGEPAGEMAPNRGLVAFPVDCPDCLALRDPERVACCPEGAGAYSLRVPGGRGSRRA